jgi:hypothetical protein
MLSSEHKERLRAEADEPMEEVKPARGLSSLLN